MGECSFIGCFFYCYFVGDYDKGYILYWFYFYCYFGCFGVCYSFIFWSIDFWRVVDIVYYFGYFDGDYCCNFDYRRKNIVEKK